MKIALYIILFSALFALPLQAAGPYYVDPVSGVDNIVTNDGESEGNAWATVLFAHTNATAGSTVYLMDGATHGDVILTTPNPAATTWGNKITFTKNPSDDPNIKTLAIQTAVGYASFYIEFNNIKIRAIDGGSTSLEVDDASSLRFIDLDITGIWNENYVPADSSIGYDLLSDGVLVNSNGAELIDDITFQGCLISQSALGIQFAGKFGDSAGDIQVIDCNIHTIARSQIILAFTNDGTNGHVLIQGNHLHNQYQFNQIGTTNPTHGAGVAIKCPNVTVRNNIVHATGTTGGIQTYSNGGVPGIGYEDILIENNLLYDLMQQYALNLFDVHATGSYIVRNNTVIGIHAPTSSGKTYYKTAVVVRPIGFSSEDGIPSADCSGLKIHNNIIVGRLIFWGDEARTPEGLDDYEEDYNYIYSGLDQNEVKMVSHDNTIVVVPVDTTDLFFESDFFVEMDANSTTLNPHRKNLNEGYKLVEASAGRDFADVNNAPLRDLLGILRGADPDAGCYEYPADADVTAPTPNPATWLEEPFALNANSISMIATTGIDESEVVEYYFDETSENSGGSDSGWVTNPVYTDFGLTDATEYTYTVQMRDNQPTPNVGTASGPASATTTSSVLFIILRN